MRVQGPIKRPGIGSAVPVTNEPRRTPTGGNPIKATNAHMHDGNTELELFTGGDARGTNSDINLPPHPENPPNNADHVLPEVKATREPRSPEVMGSHGIEKIAKALRTQRAELRAWLQKSAKRAEEDNEPSPDRHDSSPDEILRPRAELIAFDRHGVVAIDKGDHILFPGGGIDDGEPPLLAAIREGIEEADLKILNPEARDVIESTWPQGVNDFWDKSSFDGERTYFFIGLHDGDLGTTHPDREDFATMPFGTLKTRLGALIAKKDWAQRNNEVRLELVEAAEAMIKKNPDLRGRKLASEAPQEIPRHHHGWSRSKRSLRRIFAPQDRKAFIAALMAFEERHGHKCFGVHTFPDDRVLIVLRGDDDVTNADFNFAKKLNGFAEKHAAEVSGSMRTHKESEEVPEPAPGLLVDLDGTLVDTDWDPQTYRCSGQTLRKGVREVLGLYKKQGFRIIAVTNRSGDPKGLGADSEHIRDVNAKTLELVPEIDDIVYCEDFADAGRKPAPAMLDYAQEAFALDPVVAMVGNSTDDRDAAEATEIPYHAEDVFFSGDPRDGDELPGGLEVLKDFMGSGQEKRADAIALAPRNEYIYVNPEGSVFVDKDSNRRLKFPTTGKGLRAPHSPDVAVVPPEGIPDPGFHGYNHALHIGEGAPPEGTPGSWVPGQDVLKQLYGSMGLETNKPFRDIDRARARIIHRALRRAHGTPASPVPAISLLRPQESTQ